ncbi:hypothetical protein [Roseibium sp.]|uniref:hypothetical protein n=1 Tax=Roseibium sp. TaxID=1936156 RepID=UPI003D0CCE2D
MRRPAPSALAAIRHPGPKASNRLPHVLCVAEADSFEPQAGEGLLEALGRWAERNGYSSAVLELQGLSLNSFDYVMPDRAIDDRHAAWYSDTHTSKSAILEDAVAILGWKDGDWFAHIHAYWREGGAYRLGHLLPHTLIVRDATRLQGYGLKGARFEAQADPETEFTLFRVAEDRTTPVQEEPNALITTLAPFEDLHESIAALAGNLSPGPVAAHGLGSLAGAEFHEAAPMTGLISEILLKTPAGMTSDGVTMIPVRCVDLEGHLHEGRLVPGAAPTLVTCELLLRRTGTEPLNV